MREKIEEEKFHLMKVGFTYSDLQELPIWKRTFHLKKLMNENMKQNSNSDVHDVDQAERRKSLMEKYNVKMNEGIKK